MGYGQKKQKNRNTPSRGAVTGTLRVTRKGIGYVAIEGSDTEIMIAPRFMRTALHGDRVRVVPFARPVSRHNRTDDTQVEGEIVGIEERSLTRVVGTLRRNRKFSFVVPDDRRITRDIYLDPDADSEARADDKVLVELLPWEDERQNPQGTIIEILGKAGDARVEVMSVARSFGLPESFPDEVEREAAAFPGTIAEKEIRSRTDLRTTFTCTIDPVDAKDFDDAVSYEPLANGRVRLGVHIADVSHFVREGSALDAEAFARGTSVYMVNEVIPMLPERLSNDLCSLRPHVDRLTYSVLMDVSPDGTVEDYQITKTVIHSARRFAYEEVQEILSRGAGEHADVLLPLHGLTKTLLKRRQRNGSIDFDTGEAKFVFDDSGLPTRIIKKERLDAHRLIEECMLLANKVVARHCGRVKAEADQKPFLYRVHDLPDPSRLTDLANFVRQFGFSLDAKNGVTAKALQKLLHQVKGSEVETVINEVALRSMAKAVYAEKNIGHFGLAFKYYTHFTSPIRRYPDLVVHRLLHEYGRGTTARRLMQLRQAMPEIAQQSSERERVAVEAERASVKVMQVEYMKRHLGDEFDGVIAGVTNFGMFIEINDLLVEGLIRVRDMTDDYYLYDEKHYTLRGRSRGRTYRLGDKIRVKVLAVSPEDREIDFGIAE